MYWECIMWWRHVMVAFTRNCEHGKLCALNAYGASKNLKLIFYLSRSSIFWRTFRESFAKHLFLLLRVLKLWAFFSNNLYLILFLHTTYIKTQSISVFFLCSFMSFNSWWNMENLINPDVGIPIVEFSDDDFSIELSDPGERVSYLTHIDVTQVKVRFNFWKTKVVNPIIVDNSWMVLWRRRLLGV